MYEAEADLHALCICVSLSFRKTVPGKRRQQVTPAMTAEMRWLRSLKEGLVNCSSTLYVRVAEILWQGSKVLWQCRFDNHS